MWFKCLVTLWVTVILYFFFSAFKLFYNLSYILASLWFTIGILYSCGFFFQKSPTKLSSGVISGGGTWSEACLKPLPPIRYFLGPGKKNRMALTAKKSSECYLYHIIYSPLVRRTQNHNIFIFVFNDVLNVWWEVCDRWSRHWPMKPC